MFMKREPTPLEKEIERAVQRLSDWDVATEEYDRLLNTISRLEEIKAEEKPDRLSKETMAVLGTNLLGIILILRYEQLNVITSRAMSLLIRPKQV